MKPPAPRLRLLATALVATLLLTGTALAGPGDNDADDAPYGMMGPGYGSGPNYYGMGPGMMGPGYGYGRGYGYGMGPGMMGPGYGYGPRGGYGMGPGMMGPGYGYGYGPRGGYGMGPGMMGNYGYGMGPGMMGYGYGMGPGYGAAPNNGQPLSTDEVHSMMERWLAIMGNPHIKLGKVTAKDDNTIQVEIVTAEGGALVDRLDVDRHTGRMTRVR